MSEKLAKNKEFLENLDTFDSDEKISSFVENLLPDDIMSFLTTVRESIGKKGNNFLKKGDYAQGVKEFHRIERIYQIVIDKIDSEKKFKDLYSLIPFLEDTAEYWKKYAMDYRVDKYEDDVQKYWKEGLDFKKNGNYDQALSSLDKALDLNLPDHQPTILVDKGNIYFDTFDYQNAISFYEKALNLDPQFTSAFYNIALSYENLGNYARAEVYYNKILEIFPEDLKVLLNMGNIFVTTKKLDEALKYYEKVLVLDPKNYDAHYGIGATLWEMVRKLEPEGKQKEFVNKKCEEALEHFNKALGSTKNTANVYNGIGNINFELKKYDEALKNYQKALEIEPTEVFVLNNKGATLLKLNNIEEAITVYEKAIDLDPYNMPSQLTLVEILLLSEQYKKVEESTKELITKNSNTTYHFIINVIMICNQVLQGDKKAVDSSIDVLIKYSSPSYTIDKSLWMFDDLQKFLKENEKLSEEYKEIIYLLIDVFYNNVEISKALKKLKKFKEVHQKKGISFFNWGKKKTSDEEDINFKIKNTASPDRLQPGYYNWEIHLDELEDILDTIESVTYHLHPTFTARVRKVKDRSTKFQLTNRGWGSFNVKVEIALKNKRIVTKYHFLDLNVTA